MEQKLCKGTKNVLREQKCSTGTKKIPESQNEVYKGLKFYLLWHIMILNYRVWPYVALYVLVWHCMAYLFIVLWLYMTFSRAHR